MLPDKLFDTHAQGRPRVPRSNSLGAGPRQLQGLSHLSSK